jgi:hypothetical protein
MVDIELMPAEQQDLARLHAIVLECAQQGDPRLGEAADLLCRLTRQILRGRGLYSGGAATGGMVNGVASLRAVTYPLGSN